MRTTLWLCNLKFIGAPDVVDEQERAAPSRRAPGHPPPSRSLRSCNSAQQVILRAVRETLRDLRERCETLITNSRTPARRSARGARKAGLPPARERPRHSGRSSAGAPRRALLRGSRLHDSRRGAGERRERLIGVATGARSRRIEAGRHVLALPSRYVSPRDPIP